MASGNSLLSRLAQDRFASAAGDVAGKSGSCGIAVFYLELPSAPRMKCFANSLAEGSLSWIETGLGAPQISENVDAGR
jgi:hypothetical protein